VGPDRFAEIEAPSGDVLVVPLFSEDGCDSSCLIIDGLPYHLERISRDDLLSHYKVDDDPAYDPRSDVDGFCYILAPYSD